MKTRELQRAVGKLVAPIKRRAQLMVGRAVLTVIDESTKCQTVQAALGADEVREDVERFQNYGFSSYPHANVEGCIVFVGGNRSHGICVATEDRENRPTTLGEGDACLYTANGIRVHVLESADQVHLGNAPTDWVALTTPTDDAIEDLRGWVSDIVDAITNGTVTPADGGAALQTSIVSSLPTVPGSISTVAADEVKAK